MILCVRDWLMPVGDIQAEKMAFQSLLLLRIFIYQKLEMIS
jgi:hypothetical protein